MSKIASGISETSKKIKIVLDERIKTTPVPEYDAEQNVNSVWSVKVSRSNKEKKTTDSNTDLFGFFEEI
jgi:hypothetical protein